MQSNEKTNPKFKCEVCGADPKWLVEDASRQPRVVCGRMAGWEKAIESVHLFCDRHNRPSLVIETEAKWVDDAPASEQPPTPVGNALYLAMDAAEVLIGRLRVLMSRSHEPFEPAENVRALLLLTEFETRFGDFIKNYGGF
jgi:hypothetical protein